MPFSRAVLLSRLLLTGTASAQGIRVDDVIPNFVGAGLGVTTQWLGSKDMVWGIVPGGRMELENRRFIEVYGPAFDMNLLDHPHWEFGPAGALRLGRKDVKDPVVNLLPSIDTGLEAGLFVGWHYVNLEGIPYRARLGLMATTAISGGATGT